MKTIFLINKQQGGTTALCLASPEEWLDIIRQNRSLPLEQRRYFILDCIEEGGTIDRMIIEVPLSEYRRWNSLHTMSERNRKEKQRFQHLSLEAELGDASRLALADCLADETDIEADILDAILIEELRNRLSAWKPWAEEMLDCYLDGKKRSCSAELAEKYGVSEQVIRKYKRQFESFIKNFLAGVSF